jgi:predicted transcriptional regulator
VSASITELASAAGNAISFFSEALHELEYLGLNTFAVYDERINTSIDIYKQFQCTVTLKNGLIVKKWERACQNKYYQSEISLSDLNSVLCKRL